MTGGDGATALLVVDVQRDYLDRPGLVPSEDEFVAAVARTISAFRAADAPVAHVHTVVRPDGADAMSHWRASGLKCVEGTPGVQSPAAVAPAAGEYVARKQGYRGFADPALHQWLCGQRVRRVVVAGLYEQACVRETALDAVEAGYEVVIAADAVATDRPDHAALTREWLSERVVSYLRHDELIELLATEPCVDAPPTGDGAVKHAAAGAAATRPEWAARPATERADVLDGWAEVVTLRAEALAQQIVDEVGKPRRAAQDEVLRAVAHIRTAARLARDRERFEYEVADGVTVARTPVGVIGLLMPWNNPVALPVGKIAPALAFGNAVVFKPAPEAEATAAALLATVAEAGIPEGLVGLATGGIGVGSAVVREPLVDAVALTGSVAAGRKVGVECAHLGKPLQGELGGNNAAIVLADADLTHDVPALLRGAFAFGGQRCTAVRRLVVEETVVARVLEIAAAAMDDLVLGPPGDETTDVGPLVSVVARNRVASVVETALAAGAELVCQAQVPEGLGGEAWFPPTVVLTRDPGDLIVQEETFGPVVVVQPARDVDEAIALANGVPQGLLMGLCTSDPGQRARLLRAAEVGIVQIGSGPPAIHADAPFGGWKASGIGPPEHGVCDIDFLTRIQVRYRAAGDT